MVIGTRVTLIDKVRVKGQLMLIPKMHLKLYTHEIRIQRLCIKCLSPIKFIFENSYLKMLT